MVDRDNFLPWRRSVRDFSSDQSGSFVVWFAFGLIAIVGMGALAVDMSRLYVLETQLQGAADAAALAAIDELPDQDAARSTAIEYATKNLDLGTHGAVLSNSDVEFGFWDEENRIFDPAASPAHDC